MSQRKKTVKELWAGRTFKCTETGEVVTIPENVRPRDFFKVGECFVDVGDGYYSRYGGLSLIETTNGDND